MAKKAQSTQATQATSKSGAYFIGKYVSDIAYVVTASALSQSHAIMLGAAGRGKTDITLATMRQIITGENIATDAVSMVRFEPTKTPDVILGTPDPAVVLDATLTPKERTRRIIDGTVYDPSVKFCIYDEIGRANDAIFDAALDPLDRKDTRNGATIVATSNFMPTTERVQAFIDRIALWHWVRAEGVDERELVRAQLLGRKSGLKVDYDLPTWDTIEQVRRADAGERSVSAVQDVVETLATEARKSGLSVHPRRLTQWASLVYSMGVFYSGDADFATVDERATRVLRYAMPSLTQEQATEWDLIAQSIVDAVGSQIDAIRTQAYEYFQKVAQSDASERTQLITTLGKFLVDTHTSLKQVGGNDARVQETIDETTQWMGLAVQGKPLV